MTPRNFRARRRSAALTSMPGSATPDRFIQSRNASRSESRSVEVSTSSVFANACTASSGIGAGLPSTWRVSSSAFMAESILP